MAKRASNFLKMVPEKNDTISWKETEDGLVQIVIHRNSILDRVVRVLYKTPETMKVDLDKIGSCVWNSIDSQRNMEQIGLILTEEFGNDVNPVYNRLAEFINLLRNNKFIKLKKAD